MERDIRESISRSEGQGIKRWRPLDVLLAALLLIILLLGACNGNSGGEAVVDVTPAGQDQEEAETAEDIAEAEGIAENDAMTETLEAAESTGTTETATSDADVDDITVITDTELITGTEVTTDVTVTTDTVVIEEQLVTTVITDTELITDVAKSSDSSTTTETEVITNTEDISPQTTTGEAETDVDVTPIPPTPTPTVVVEVTRVVTETQVVTETVETTAVATPQPGQGSQPQTGTAVVIAFIGIEGSTGRSIRASTLLDADFETSDGDVGGEIQDLVIDIQNGQVLYVLLEYGGILDVGDTDMPVPLSAFSWGSEDELILNIDGQRLENFPGVSNDWPVPDDTNWDLDVRNFWEGIDVDPGFEAEQSMHGVRRASDLIGGPISGGEFGDRSVQDMLISLGEGRVSYVLISELGVGADDGWYVVPFSAFDTTAPQNGFTLNPDFDPGLLDQAPRFDMATLGQSPVFTEGYDDEWQGYWDDAGYPVMAGDE